MTPWGLKYGHWSGHNGPGKIMAPCGQRQKVSDMSISSSLSLYIHNSNFSTPIQVAKFENLPSRCNFSDFYFHCKHLKYLDRFEVYKDSLSHNLLGAPTKMTETSCPPWRNAKIILFGNRVLVCRISCQVGPSKGFHHRIRIVIFLDASIPIKLATKAVVILLQKIKQHWCTNGIWLKKQLRSLHRGEEIAAKGSRKQESVVERGKWSQDATFFGTQINEVRKHTLVSHIF